MTSTIRDWVERRFGGPYPKVIIECGSHNGSDTAWMAALPGVTMYCFEPDARNRQPVRENVTVVHAAVGAVDGEVDFIPSRERFGAPYTKSGSILRPTGHLTQHPEVKFGAPVLVACVRLDTFAAQAGLNVVDFQWWDVQGAEGELIRGARQTLARTRYLYTEYSDDPQYEGQPSLAEILDMLPGWRVIEQWPSDVLLVNDGWEP